MKQIANTKRRDVNFHEGDWVMVNYDLIDNPLSFEL